MRLDDIDGFIIDLDGTVYKGGQAIEGAMEAIASLRKHGKRIVFLSNRGNISRVMCQEKLLRMGISATADEILLSSTVTAGFLKMNDPQAKVWTLGDSGLREELLSWDITLANTPEEADKLVITLHESLTYKELNQAFRAVNSGAEIIATNADKSFPGEEGESIDVAGMIGAIVASTGKEVKAVIGKPSPIMAEAALRCLGVPPENCIVIGDSLLSDIALGKRAGMRTALVLSGSTSIQDAESAKEQPDLIWESIAELVSLLELKEELV